jgi:hypothetical protein
MSGRAPSPLAIYERARRLANIAVWTVQIQRRRLSTDEPEDGEFIFRRWADFQFFIIALTRLRRAAALAAKVPALASDIQKAIHEFDAAVPALKNMRDVAEHFDDYALDKGRTKSVRRAQLEVGSFNNTELEWLGYRLNADDALKAARRLFQKIKLAQSSLQGQRRSDR